MKPIAFKMKLKPGCELDYKKRHDEIWPELKSALKTAGIHEYSIFLDRDTLMLFGVLKVDGIGLFDELPAKKIMQEWWFYMSDLMETNADYSPVSKVLEEVFYLL